MNESNGTSWRPTAAEIAFLVAAIAATLVARFAFSGVESVDYRDYLSPWYDQLKAKGFSALGEGFANYTPPYLYLLWFATLLPLPKLIAIKLISLLFEYGTAAVAFALLKAAKPARHVPYAGALAFLMLPTVLLNGSFWGQCDSVFTFFTLFAVYFLFKGKPWPAFALLGVAFSFKLQSLLAVSAFCLALFGKKAKPWHLLCLPLAYAVLCAPAAIAGRPLGALALVYLDQASTFGQLTMSAPNLYQWLPPDASYAQFSLAGYALAGFSFSLVLYMGWRKAGPLDAAKSLALAALGAYVLTFTLPQMHERYNYLPDAMLFLAACMRPRYLPAALVALAVSFCSYMPYLMNGFCPVDMSLLPLGALFAIAYLAREVFAQKPGAASHQAPR
jgi:Gpi18-like mannosyltransferase